VFPAGDIFQCAKCVGANQQKMHEAGCLDPAIEAWCAGQPMPPPPPPSFFCGSRLITQAAWEHRLLEWCEKRIFGPFVYENEEFSY
jgi:hypothetical protein